VAVKKIGSWDLARALVAQGSPAQLKRATLTSLRQEGHALRARIVRGFKDQDGGGKKWQEPSVLTLARRRLDGFRGRKALLRRADLRNAISVEVLPSTLEVFVGVPRKARAKHRDPGAKGDLVDVAQIQEFGAGPYAIRITPAMRRFLGMLFREAGTTGSRGSGGGSAGVVVIQIPARPFLRPAFAKHKIGIGNRFLLRVAQNLGWAPKGRI